MRTTAILFGALLTVGCGRNSTAGEGDLVATLSSGTLPIGMYGDDTILHVMTGQLTADAGGVFGFARVDVGSGRVGDEPTPTNLSWSDFDELGQFPGEVPFLTQDVTQGTSGEAFVMGFYGITTVPFDGGPSELLHGSDVTVLSSGAAVGSGFLQGFRLTSTGAVDAAYCIGDRMVCGSISPEGDWTELAQTDDTCGPTPMLSDANAVYFTSTYSLWRVDRNTHEARVLYYLPDNGGALMRIAQTSDSVVMILPTFVDGAQVGFEFAKIAKTGGPLVPIRSLDPHSPVDTGMVADDESLYYLDRAELDRISLSTGALETLAKLDGAGAANQEIFLYPVLGATRVYFIDLALDSGGHPATAFVRSVSK